MNSFAGFKLNSSTMAALVFKYSNVHNQVSLESFMCCLAKLMKLFSKYNRGQLFKFCSLNVIVKTSNHEVNADYIGKNTIIFVDKI